MAEQRYEAERAAWIKGRRWRLGAEAAARRADRLSRRARQLDRSEINLGDTAMSEAEGKGAFKRWTEHDDSKTSALGFMAFVVVYCVVVPIYFGLAWLTGQVAYRLWERVGGSVRVRVWPYLAAAAVLAVVFALGRPAGLDLAAIHWWAGVLETATGGLVAPAVLSRWYAAGWVSWLEIQVVLGLALAGWQAYAWGWEAPSVRRAVRERRGTVDQKAKIISSLGEQGSTGAKAAPDRGEKNSTSATAAHDPLKIISGAHGAKAIDNDSEGATK